MVSSNSTEVKPPVDVKSLVNKIAQLTSSEREEITKIILYNSSIKCMVNANGTFVNANKLEQETLRKMELFVKTCIASKNSLFAKTNEELDRKREHDLANFKLTVEQRARAKGGSKGGSFAQKIDILTEIPEILLNCKEKLMNSQAKLSESESVKNQQTNESEVSKEPTTTSDIVKSKSNNLIKSRSKKSKSSSNETVPEVSTPISSRERILKYIQEIYGKKKLISSQHKKKSVRKPSEEADGVLTESIGEADEIGDSEGVIDLYGEEIKIADESPELALETTAEVEDTDEPVEETEETEEQEETEEIEEPEETDDSTEIVNNLIEVDGESEEHNSEDISEEITEPVESEITEKNKSSKKKKESKKDSKIDPKLMKIKKELMALGLKFEDKISMDEVSYI
ncbi:Uncharacterised protein [uncultured archaeon]|nr:Uncharacterised protein [uncultured archaeon]